MRVFAISEFRNLFYKQVLAIERNREKTTIPNNLKSKLFFLGYGLESEKYKSRTMNSGFNEVEK